MITANYHFLSLQLMKKYR